MRCSLDLRMRVVSFVQDGGSKAAFHTSPDTTHLSAPTGAPLLVLPPYSPALNPIEHDFAALKKHR